MKGSVIEICALSSMTRHANRETKTIKPLEIKSRYYGNTVETNHHDAIIRHNGSFISLLTGLGRRDDSAGPALCCLPSILPKSTSK